MQHSTQLISYMQRIFRGSTPARCRARSSAPWAAPAAVLAHLDASDAVTLRADGLRVPLELLELLRFHRLRPLLLYPLPLLLDVLLKLGIADLEAVFCRQLGAHGFVFIIARHLKTAPLLRR